MIQIWGYSLQDARLIGLMHKGAFIKMVHNSYLDKCNPTLNWVKNHMSVTGNTREVEIGLNNRGKLCYVTKDFYNIVEAK